MQTVKNLISSTNSKKLGNHRVEVVNNMGIPHRKYIYYSTVIAREYPDTKEFIIDDSYGTASTTRACNAYRKEFLDKGYTELYKTLS